VFERFTPPARQAVVLASDEARELGHDWIGTEHLLLGLLREDQGLAAHTLRELGLDEMRLRDDVVTRDGRREPLAAGKLPFTSVARDALVGAATWANAWEHEAIGTEHMLAGVLDEPGSIAVRLLADRSHTPSGVAERLLGAIGFPDPSGEAARFARPSPKPDERRP
jgi:ATP-dependent Clp protease ATP-binding subunit ClpC